MSEELPDKATDALTKASLDSSGDQGTEIVSEEIFNLCYSNLVDSYSFMLKMGLR